MSVPSHPSQLRVLPAHMMCRYRSKVCTEPRAIKLDGTLHKLCEFHRQKANLNQQKLHQRHRMERALLELSGAAAGKSKRRRRRTEMMPVLSAIEPLSTIEPLSADDSHAPELCTEDVAMLELLLFDMQTLPATSALLFGSGLSPASWVVDDGLFAELQAVIV